MKLGKVTVPLKIKLLPSRETYHVPLETGHVSFESFLGSRECTVSINGLHRVTHSDNNDLRYKHRLQTCFTELH